MLHLAATTSYVDTQLAEQRFFNSNDAADTPQTKCLVERAERFALHQQNVGVRTSDRLIFHAISLALCSSPSMSLYRGYRAYHHPSLQLLCEFWRVWSNNQTSPVGFPYIQCYWGDAHYHPLIMNASMLPVEPCNEVDHAERRAAGCLMGDIFYVTYLQLSAYRNTYYTVQSAPYLTTYRDDLPQLMVESLRRFPHDYPKLWTYLSNQYVR